MKKPSAVWTIAALTPGLLAAVLLAACGGEDESASQTEPAASAKLSGTIEIDGSSTVFPVSEAVAEEFGKLHRDVRVNVGVSGTGGGFKRVHGRRDRRLGRVAADQRQRGDGGRGERYRVRRA